MSELSEPPIPYRVTYSELVRNDLRALLVRARQRGLADRFFQAVKDLDKRLRTYPQFGEPLMDLELKPAQLWVMCMPPLVVRYFLDEEQRLVIVSLAIRPMPHCGLDP